MCGSHVVAHAPPPPPHGTRNLPEIYFRKLNIATAISFLQAKHRDRHLLPATDIYPGIMTSAMFFTTVMAFAVSAASANAGFSPSVFCETSSGESRPPPPPTIRLT